MGPCWVSARIFVVPCPAFGVQEEPIVLMWSPGSLQTLKDCFFLVVGVTNAYCINNAATQDVVGHGHERCCAHCHALRHSLVR